MVAVEAAGVALRRSRLCVVRTKSLKPRRRARNRFARIAQARRKALGPYLSITRNCLARNRVFVLAGVVAIARELVDRIAHVAHMTAQHVDAAINALPRYRGHPSGLSCSTAVALRLRPLPR